MRRFAATTTGGPLVDDREKSEKNRAGDKLSYPVLDLWKDVGFEELYTFVRGALEAPKEISTRSS